MRYLCDGKHVVYDKSHLLLAAVPVRSNISQESVSLLSLDVHGELAVGGCLLEIHWITHSEGCLVVKGHSHFNLHELLITEDIGSIKKKV